MKKLYEFVIKKTYEAKGYLWVENEDELPDMIKDLDERDAFRDADLADVQISYSEAYDSASISGYDIYNSKDDIYNED